MTDHLTDTEPRVVYATVRDGVEEWHVECRMSDGQKGAFVRVDYEFPELAHKIAALLSTPANGKANAPT